ncbi:MAG: hypothetical protein II098_07460 [Treponema sp.]|nr:hypothetical protein [Treponema sp.]
MKALIIADNEDVVKKIQDVLESDGCDTIVYKWLLKALDNIIEIAPDVTVISAFDYPRHWKTLVQFENAVLEKRPVIILFRPETISEDEIEKEIALGVKGYISELDEKGIKKLTSLVNEEKARHLSTAAEDIEDAAYVEELDTDEVPTVDSLLGSEFVENNSGSINSVKELLESLELPTVDNIISSELDGFLPTVDDILRPGVSEVITEDERSRNVEYSSSKSIDIENLKNILIPGIDSILEAVSELPVNGIPSVDDFIEKLNISLIDIPETHEEQNISSEHDESGEKPKSESLNDACSVLEASDLPTVDDLLGMHTESSLIPTLSDIEEYLDSRMDGVADVAGYKTESCEEIPAVEAIEAACSEILPSVAIPSVDEIAVNEHVQIQHRRKHSLLARILELYGE